MKKIIILLIITTILCSCVKTHELSEKDNNIVFSFEDLLALNVTQYKIKPYQNGKEYNFIKKINDFGFNSIYTVHLTDDNYQNQVTLKSFVYKFYSEDDLKAITNGDHIVKEAYKENLMDLDISEFSADYGFYIKTPDYLNIKLKRENILFNVILEGHIDISIEDMKETIKEKIDFLYNTGIDDCL